MPEQYNRWMADNQARQLLVGNGFGNLSEEHQILLEEAYDVVISGGGQRTGDKQIRNLIRQTGSSLKPLFVRHCINSLNDVQGGFDVSGGQDPQVYNGGSHHNGLSEV